MSQFWISSRFGPRKKSDGSYGFHHAIDLAAVRGTPVHASADGIVVEARYVTGYGNTILIAHADKYKTRYAHLNSIAVPLFAKVAAGTKIGTVGATGHVVKRGGDGSHLHFEIMQGNRRINPLTLLPRLS